MEMHTCSQPCNRKLQCGKHRCRLNCHAGPCPPCLEIASLEEIRCRCGKTVIEPPIPCGYPTVPDCWEQCSVPRECGHPADHYCHEDGPCPPCVTLVQKMCLGGHKVMPFKTPCHQPAVSCGEVCGKPLPCGVHNCTRVCHGGPCAPEATGESCGDPCWKMMQCGHVCTQPCHGKTPCPMEKCTVQFSVECKCGTVHKVMCAEYRKAVQDSKQEYADAQREWALAQQQLSAAGLPPGTPPLILSQPFKARTIQSCCA
jgi:transcriptional repressor NF-X1